MKLQQKYSLSEIIDVFRLLLPDIIKVTDEVFNVFSARKESLSDLTLIFLKYRLSPICELKNYFTGFKISPIFSNRIKSDTACS